MDADALSREVMSLLALRESAEVPGWAAKRLQALLGASQAGTLRVFPIGAVLILAVMIAPALRGKRGG